MGWHQIPEFDSVSSADDNSFAGSRIQSTMKVSVKLPVDDWLCRKMEKLNLSIAEGYPSKTLKLLDSSGSSLSSHPGHLDGTTCMLTRKTLIDPLCVFGLRNQQSWIVRLAGWPDIVYLLPHPLGPLARTFWDAVIWKNVASCRWTGVFGYI